MATAKGVFDLPIEKAMDVFVDELEDLHDVELDPDPVMAGMATMSISMAESPLWAYPLAAAVGAAPIVLGSRLPWVNLTGEDAGLRFDEEWSQDLRTLATVLAIVVVLACLGLAFWIATQFQRQVPQATLTFAPDKFSGGTKVRVDGHPDPYVYRAVRKVFTEFDREEIERRGSQASASSMMEWFEFGPGQGRTLLGRPRRPQVQQVAAAGAVGEQPPDPTAAQSDQTVESAGLVESAAGVESAADIEAAAGAAHALTDAASPQLASLSDADEAAAAPASMVDRLADFAAGEDGVISGGPVTPPESI